MHSGCQGKTWVLIAVLPLSGCVTLGKLLTLSEQGFCKKRIMILTSMSCCEDLGETVHEMPGQMRSLVEKAGGSCYCQWVTLGHFLAGTLRERSASPGRWVVGGPLMGTYVLVVFFHCEFQTRAQTGNFPGCSHQHQRLSHRIGKIWNCAYGGDMKPVHCTFILALVQGLIL